VNVEDILSKTISELMDKRLDNAIEVLNQLFLQRPSLMGNDEFEAVKRDYQLMVDYMGRGLIDQQRASLYASLLQRLYRVTANLEISWRCKHVPAYIDAFKISDFEKVEDFKSECEYILSTRKVVIFNKEVEGENFSFFINKDIPLESCLHSINKYLEWLSDAKAALINYYNEHCGAYTPEADDNWYNTLEVYSGHLDVGSIGISAHISAGDIFTPDHLLEIDFEGKEITHIGWDG